MRIRETAARVPKRKLFSWKRFIAIVKKEFIQVRRDRISMMMPIMMPIVMMFLFGYAVNTEVDQVPTAVLDLNRTAESRAFIEHFSASGYFRIDGFVGNEQEIRDAVNADVIKVGLIIPADFDRKIQRGEVAAPQLIVDGTDPTTARTAYNSGMLVSEMATRELLNERLSRMGGLALKAPSVRVTAKVWFNPEMQSVRFTIPALVGLILQNITLMLTAFALVREKERSTIEQLIVTPIRSFELIMGKLVPYVAIGYAGFLFALSICMFWFGIPVAGSLPLLLSIGFLFVLCSLAMGMLISTFARTQLQAMMAMVFVLLPSILLSGFIFPREAMPPFIAAFGNAIPLTYFLEILRGIVLKGVGMQFLWKNTLMLGGFMLAILSLAILRFRKSLD
jgi:ABC-2 type transport system permease protein